MSAVFLFLTNRIVDRKRKTWIMINKTKDRARYFEKSTKEKLVTNSTITAGWIFREL